MLCTGPELCNVEEKLILIWLTTSTPKLDDVPIIKPEEKPNLESGLTVSWCERGKLYFLGFSEKVGSVNVNCFMFI